MYKTCKSCNKEYWTTHPKISRYCCKNCMAEYYKTKMKGSGNPNYRNKALFTCKNCAKEFFSYDKRRIYCSRDCWHRSTEGMNHKRSVCRLGGGGLKDKNHDEIVRQCHEAGIGVIDTHLIGDGFPDLILIKNGVFLIEIKNPNSGYGKSGLSKIQQRFFDGWNGQVNKAESFDEIALIIGL